LAGVNCKLHSETRGQTRSRQRTLQRGRPGGSSSQGHDVMGISNERPAVGSQYPVHEDASGAGGRVIWVGTFLGSARPAAAEARGPENTAASGSTFLSASVL